jgi:putative membrane protein
MELRMLLAYAYLLHLLSGFVLIAVFFAIYTWITPFDEIALIREGNMAAALSLAGAVVGFCLTLASSILHSDSYQMFLAWSVGAMFVQSAAYAGITRILPQMNGAIEHNNAAMGALMGTASLALGIINAACLS